MEESKEIIYEHTLVEKMLHRLNVWFLPFRWGINPYRGCEHNCLYCNARYTHEYLGLPTGKVAYKIIVKDNAAEILDIHKLEDFFKMAPDARAALDKLRTE